MGRQTDDSWFVILAAILWGTTGTAQALAPSGAQPLTVGAVRLLVGAGTLMVIVVARGERPSRLEIGRTNRWPLLFAALAMAAYQFFFFAAVFRTGVTLAAIVTIGSAPISTGVLAYLIRSERPRNRWYGATLLAIAGCTLLILGSGSLEVDIVGIGFALGAGLMYALYSVQTKGLLDSAAAVPVTAAIFTLAALFTIPVLIWGDFKWLREAQGLMVALHLGVVTVGLAYLLFARGLARIPVTTAATLSLAEPLTAALLGIFLLGERLSAASWFGVSLLFTGLVITETGRTAVEEPQRGR